MARHTNKTTGKAEKINVLQQAVLVSFRTRSLGNTAPVDSEKINTTADKKMVRANKILLDSAEYREIYNHRRNWERNVLGRMALPSALSGTATFVLPLSLISALEQSWIDFAMRDAELIDALVAVWDERIRESKNLLKDEFNSKNYLPASQVRDAYGISLTYLTLGTPESLRSIDSALHAREVEKFYAALEETAREIDNALTSEFAELVSWMVERLDDSGDGKKKAFGKPFDGRLERMQEFFRLFKDRNLTQNAKLETLVEKGKALLANVDAESVKGDQEFRKRVREGFVAVKTTLDAMVEVKPSRRIVLED